MKKDSVYMHVHHALISLRDSHGTLDWGAEVDILRTIIHAVRCYDNRRVCNCD